ncbi:MAG: DUF1456 family protein [Spirochaetales bacterium]|nr:DUF1456 family protein [Spirochaetales bacterium]
MKNNDVLRSLRYALNIKDSDMITIFGNAGYSINRAELLVFLKKEEEKGYIPLKDVIMTMFLDGLIVYYRGEKGNAPAQKYGPQTTLNNNQILKKIRIALELKADDMIAIMKLAGINLSPSELSALFRKEGHKNHKVCGDQFLRNFLRGLTLRYRNK